MKVPRRESGELVSRAWLRLSTTPGTVSNRANMSRPLMAMFWNCASVMVPDFSAVARLIWETSPDT